MCVLAAASSGMFILRLEACAKVADSTALNAVYMLVVAALCIPWMLVIAAYAGVSLSGVVRCIVKLTMSNYGAVMYLGIVSTAATNWLQTLGQDSVPATQAVIVFALDAVWGCIFSYFILGEVLDTIGLIGAGFVVGAAMYQVPAVAPISRQGSDSA